MCNTSGKTVLLRMNGVAPGFLREYGCRTCPQCSSSKPQAHISASLLVKDLWEQQRRLAYHILFDCGLGAIDSLVDFGSPPVDHVFISHGHPYHALGLDRLVWGQVRHGGRLPIPVHCTEKTLKRGPQRIYPWFFNRRNPTEPKRTGVKGKKDKEFQLFHVSVTPGAPEKVATDKAEINLRITPVAVFQGRGAGAPVIWVVEFGEGEKSYKLVLAWEIMNFVPRFREEDKDPTYDERYEDKNLPVPEASEQHLSQRFGTLFRNVDDLIFDGNTRTPRKDTHHMSIEAGLRFLIPEIEPKRTWIAHYSGHEDPGGPMSDDDLQKWVDDEKQKYNLTNHFVKLAKHGMVLAYDL